METLQDLANTKNITSILINGNKIDKVEKITKVYTTVDEVIESAEYEEIWEGFHSNPSVMIRLKDNFVCAIVVKEKDRFGKPIMYNLWKFDGYYSIKRVKISTCLSDSPMQTVSFMDDMINFHEAHVSKNKMKELKQVCKSHECIAMLN